jgi:hypothetical protein
MGTWKRIQQLNPVVRVPTAIATGLPVLVDCLLPARDVEGSPWQPDYPVYLTRMLTATEASGLPLPGGLEWPPDASAGLLMGSDRDWPVLGLDHQVFVHRLGRGGGHSKGVSTWLALLALAGRGNIGLAMDAPGDSLCPVFAPRRWTGAAAATLLSTPSDCATVCLDIRLCACVDSSNRLDWHCLRHALVESVAVGNEVLDELAGVGVLPGNRSPDLRRLALHLSDLGELALRLGMQPGLPSTLSRLSQVVRVARDAAMGESLRLGRLHGPFPALEEEWARLGMDPVFRNRIRALMKRYWLRNSQLLTLSPCSIMSPALSPKDLLRWANLIPLLASVDGFSARLPPVWQDLSGSESARLLGRIWALGHNRHRVRAY